MVEATLNLPRVWVGKKFRYIPMTLNHRLHWIVRSRWNVAWKEAIWVEVMRNRHAFKGLIPFDKAEVKIILKTCRLLDVDNSYTCAKPLLDGLRYAGVLVDDSPDHLDLHVSQEKVSKVINQGVSINIKLIE